MVKKKKNKNYYFTKETEQAIIDFNSIEDVDEKNKIFAEQIHYPFYKLAENIIHTFEFYYMDIDDIESLKHRVVQMLYSEKMENFKPELGYKAFSFYTTIVKRWLINFNKVNYRKLKKLGNLEEVEEGVEQEKEVRTGVEVDLKTFISIWISSVEKELENMFSKKEDIEVAQAILTVFQTVEDLEVLKKKAIYLYIREMTNCSTPKITKVLQVLKKDFYTLYEKYLKANMLDYVE